MQKNPRPFVQINLNLQKLFLGILGYCFGGIFLHCKVNEDDLTVHQVF